MNSGRYILPPGLVELNGLQKRDIFNSLRVAMPGTIQEYNSAKRTATVQPGYNRVYNDGTEMPLPPLLDCPVFTLQGGGIHVGFPISKGDECLVVFGDANIDAWFVSGGTRTPMCNRRHDLSDGFALVGVNSLIGVKKLASALEVDEGGLADATSKISLKAGRIKISNNTKSLATVLQNLVEGIQGLTCAAPGSPVVDTTNKVATALTDIAALLY